MTIERRPCGSYAVMTIDEILSRRHDVDRLLIVITVLHKRGLMGLLLIISFTVRG